jgi:hypothetical protein
LTSPAIISKSSYTHNSVEAIIFYTDKNPTTTGRSIPSESCKIGPEDFSFANIFLKPLFRAYNNNGIVYVK